MFSIRSLHFGDPQVQGRLTVLPVYGPDTDLGFVGDVRVVDDNRGYGCLTVGVDRPTVVPVGMVFYFGHGQDRAVRRPVCIDGIQEIDVVCVEPSQGGTWRSGDKQEKAQLPPTLTAALPPEGRYEDLWRGLEFRAQHNGKDGAHISLKGLLQGRKDKGPEMDPESRGVLVFLDGRPVALEVAPSRQGFKDWWVVCHYGDMWTYEAMTLRDLPMPLGNPGEFEFPEEEGMAYIKWGPFEGWTFRDDMGYLCYVSLHDVEALRSFIPKQTERPERQEMKEWGEE